MKSPGESRLLSRNLHHSLKLGTTISPTHDDPRLLRIIPYHSPRGSQATTRQQQSWVAFTATEKAYQPVPSLTPAHHRHGSRPLPTRSSNRSASWPRRARLLLKLVLLSEIRRVLHRSRSLLVSKLSTMCCILMYLKIDTATR